MGAGTKGGILRICSCRTQRITSLKNATRVSRRFATGLRKTNNSRHLHALIAIIFLIRWFGMPNAKCQARSNQALAEQEALGCEAGGGYDSSSSSHDVRNLPNH